MLNIHELERRHRKYKFQMRLPFIVLSAVAATALAGVSFFLFFSPKEQSEPQLQPQNVIASSETIHAPASSFNEQKTGEAIQKKVEIAAVEENETLPVKQIEEEKTKEIPEIQEEPEIKIQPKRVVLAPSLGFISSEDASDPKNYIPQIISNVQEEEVVVIEELEPPFQEKKRSVAPEIKEEIIEEEPAQIIVKEKTQDIALPQEKKGSISIARRDAQKDIADVIKRFNTNHNPALSLFVAKQYYQIGDYEQAYNYALITNDINNNIEESWIIFAKSLVQLGKKEQAIQTLQKYLSQSNSSQARQLLDEINTGKFK